MAYTSNLKKTVDLPVWELLNQAPTTSTAISSWCTFEDGTHKFIYYLVSGLFYRYDVDGDCWQQLAIPNVTPVTAVSMTATGNRGYHGRVLSATSTTITIPTLRGKIFNGKSLRILQGTGYGQEKVLTHVSDNVNDFGVVTAAATTSITDSIKKWKINQWAGYTLACTFGTNATQYKKILYNDATTLYIADANLQPHDPWNNQIFAANSPYAVPAALTTQYEIISSTYSVSSWTTTPDTTSFFTTLTGGIYVVSSAAATPFFTTQYYDIANDSWQTKTSPGSILPAALGTDFSVERTGKFGSAFASGTATAGSARTLTNSSLSLTPNRYRNYRILITGGTGIGQNRRILCHTATVFTVNRPWETTPDATSTYEIWGDYDKVWLAGNGASAMYAYSPENDYWMQGHSFDDGLCAAITCKLNGWVPFGITSGTRIAAGITAVNATPTAGGTNYLVGDVLTCSVGGTGAQVIVTSISAGGVVTGIELQNAGTATGFTVGTGRATTGGTGTGCTIEITSVGVTCKVTTSTAHILRTGDSVAIAGLSDSAYNTTSSILCVNGTTTFDIITTAAANMAVATNQSTTLIVDASKNWTTNEHVGKLVQLNVAGTAPTTQVRWITANTATTLTVATIVAGVNGTSKYVIYDAKAFGADIQYKQPEKGRDGFATGGSTTTLVDSTKNWNVNQWAGYKLRIEAGTGFASGIISVISNTATTLTYSAQAFTPDATTLYEIADSWGLATAGATTTITESTTKNWIVSQWAQKRVRIIAGTNLAQEATIASNTATVLTVGTISAPDATSVYCILGVNTRSAGIDLIWLWGTSDTATVGKYMLCPRGGATNTWDTYDLTTGTWNIGTFRSPQQETLTTGSMYAYDGADTVYMQKDGTGRIFSYNAVTDVIRAPFMLTDLHSTAILGNRMEIIQTEDGVKYLYLMQHTGTKAYRTLIF
jgi:hypothetical protein